MRKIGLLFLALVMIIAACQITAFAAVNYGDIYVDDEIGTKDSVLLAQKLAKWNLGDKWGAEQEANADVFKDGVVDTRDAVLLAQYLAKWSVVLGDGDGDGVPDYDNGGTGDIEIDFGEVKG